VPRENIRRTPSHAPVWLAQSFIRLTFANNTAYPCVATPVAYIFIAAILFFIEVKSAPT
jgi:hypothetical protein